MDKIFKEPTMDSTIIHQPYTFSEVSQGDCPFNKLFGNCSSGGVDFNNKVWDCGRDFCYTFHLDEAANEARGNAHAEVPKTSNTTCSTDFYLGNKLQLVMEIEKCSQSTFLLVLPLCDCKQRCEAETWIDTSVLRAFIAPLQFSFGDDSRFLTLSFQPACTENYLPGRINEQGVYKDILYYAYLNPKQLLNIFPLDAFSKGYRGPSPTIRFLFYQPEVRMIATPTEDSLRDEELRWMYYNYKNLLAFSTIEMARNVLEFGFKSEIDELIIASSNKIIQKIESGGRLHPIFLWQLYRLLKMEEERRKEDLEIVVMLKMTVAKALRKVVMKKKKPNESRQPARESLRNILIRKQDAAREMGFPAVAALMNVILNEKNADGGQAI